MIEFSYQTVGFLIFTGGLITGLALAFIIMAFLDAEGS